jgi:hypothetical protein
MSVNVYLNSTITRNPGYKKGQHNDYFLGTRIWNDGAMPHFSLNELDEMPAEAEQFVDRVTSIDHHSTKQSQRELGIYRHESAEMQVEIQNADQKGENYLMFIKGKTLTDVRGLARLFKTGKIRPEESFEGGHQGKSHVELEAEVERLQSVVQRRTEEMNATLSRNTDLFAAVRIGENRVKAVQKITASLTNDRWQWPWIRKTSIATKIDSALNDAPK